MRRQAASAVRFVRDPVPAEAELDVELEVELLVLLELEPQPATSPPSATVVSAMRVVRDANVVSIMVLPS